MALHRENLYTMIGRVESARPGCGQERYRVWINDAIRNVINKRNYWTDLRATGIIPVPDEVNAGTISVTTGSNLVAGVGTGWPINDIVNTTLADPVNGEGFDEVGLVSMTGVQEDGILLIDQGTPSQEAVPIQRLNSSGFVGNFKFSHPIGATVWQSSLTGRQFRTGYEHPIFTILGVPDPQTLILDNAWGGAPLSTITYRIIKMYFTLFWNIRQIIAVVDQQQGVELNFNRTQQELNRWDPQRTDNSDPVAFVSFRPSPAGNMQYEVWPAPVSARQIAILATLQWPALVSGDDVPPPFLEPTIFTNLAAATALRTRMGKEDFYFDPKLAQEYERLANDALADAIASDEARAVQDFTTQLNNLMPGMNSTFWLSHDPYQVAWEF